LHTSSCIIIPVAPDSVPTTHRRMVTPAPAFCTGIFHRLALRRPCLDEPGSATRRPASARSCCRGSPRGQSAFFLSRPAPRCTLRAELNPSPEPSPSSRSDARRPAAPLRGWPLLTEHLQIRSCLVGGAHVRARLSPPVPLNLIEQWHRDRWSQWCRSGSKATPGPAPRPPSTPGLVGEGQPADRSLGGCRVSKPSGVNLCSGL
jgi:hypothetical protein